MLTEKAIAGLPLRERKKEMIRQAIIKSAEQLFEQRGYDHVTVVEIANAANVSVKTLFTYFRSKEDLLFQDSGLIDTALKAIRERAKGTSPAQAMTKALIILLKENGSPIDSLAAFHRAYGASEVLQSRFLKLWSEYEEAIAAELAIDSKTDKPDADMRFLAVQLVTLIRALTWKELYDIALKNRTDSFKAVESWLLKAAKRIG